MSLRTPYSCIGTLTLWAMFLSKKSVSAVVAYLWLEDTQEASASGKGKSARGAYLAFALIAGPWFILGRRLTSCFSGKLGW